MKIAIVQDELMRRGGAEQVVRCFHLAFPDAPIFTMAYRENLTYPDFKNCTIHTSWLNRFCKNEDILKKLFFPWGIFAMKQMQIKGFDIILMSSTYAAKYPKIDQSALVINYCHTPFRLAWYSDSYSLVTRAKGLTKLLVKGIIKIIQKIDYQAAQRSDLFIANTAEVAERIHNIYNYKGNVKVINPPVNCKNFYITEGPKEYYLVVCRLESYKKIDLIVESFNKLGLPLIIVGKGSMEAELKQMAGPNITFKNSLTSQELSKLYAECKAFIFAQKEDYGITPLEANAAGRPVIAFGEGGVLETMIPYTSDAKTSTAFFFYKQTPEHLIDAIREFEKLEFSPEFIRKHAELFNETKFIEQIRNFVLEKYNGIKPTNDKIGSTKKQPVVIAQ